jgi:hypothetical protein
LLIIGWPAATTKNLGMALFAVEANHLPRQRVLVLRAGRIGESSEQPVIRGLRSRPSIAAEAGRK